MGGLVVGGVRRVCKLERIIQVKAFMSEKVRWRWLVLACCLNSCGWAAPRRMVVVNTVLRSPRKVEDTPFLGLAQSDTGGGRPLGSQDPEDPMGDWASPSTIGIPRTCGVIVLAMSHRLTQECQTLGLAHGCALGPGRGDTTFPFMVNRAAGPC